MKYLISLIILLLALAIFLIPMCVKAQTADIPEEVKDDVPEKDNWAFGTIGIGDIDKPESALLGDIVCQKKLTLTMWELMPGGILLSEKKAEKCLRYKIAYLELFQLYQLEVKLNTELLKADDEQLEACQKKVEQLQKATKKSWWENNDFTIGFILGGIIGVALTAGIAVAAFKIAD